MMNDHRCDETDLLERVKAIEATENTDEQTTMITALVDQGPSLYPMLIHLLNSDVWNVVVMILTHIGHPVVPLLIDALDDPWRDSFAILALFELAHQATDEIVHGFHHKNDVIRSWLALALAHSHNELALSTLLSAISDQDESVRRNILSSLIRYAGDPRALQAIAQIAQHDPLSDIRNEATTILRNHHKGT